jgi:hypothetical protein
MFRMLRTILFLCRLCQADAEESIVLLGGQLDSLRTECTVDIALAAEKLLAADHNLEKLRANPKLIAHILRDGSWAHSDQQKHLWIGLLANSCAESGWDDSNQAFADMLVNITPIQAIIFIEACTRALASMRDSDTAPQTRVILSPHEMTELTRMYDVARLATDVAYLYNLGVIERLFDFTSYVETESFDITPSATGIDLFRRCQKGLGCEIPPPAPVGARTL